LSCTDEGVRRRQRPLPVVLLLPFPLPLPPALLVPFPLLLPLLLFAVPVLFPLPAPLFPLPLLLLPDDPPVAISSLPVSGSTADSGCTWPVRVIVCVPPDDLIVRVVWFCWAL